MQIRLVIAIYYWYSREFLLKVFKAFESVSQKIRGVIVQIVRI